MRPLLMILPALVPAVWSQGAEPAAASVPDAGLNPVLYDMQLQRELNELLKSVSDKDSADAAAPRVKELGEALNKNIEAIMAFLKKDRQEARDSFMMMREDEEFRQISRDWPVRLEALRKLPLPCYGSSALREALKEVKSEPKN